MRRKITLAFLILAAFLLQTTVFQYFQICVRNAEPSSDSDVRLWADARKKMRDCGSDFFSGLMIDLF